MIGEILFHLIFCTAFCSIVHVLFHKRKHDKQELSEKEIKNIRTLLKTFDNQKD